MDEWILDRSRDEGGAEGRTQKMPEFFILGEKPRERERERSLVWLGGARLSPSIWVGSAALAGDIRTYEGDAHPCQSKFFFSRI